METWIDIPGYESFYEVNHLGVVRSKTGKIRKATINKRGYQRINLSKNGEVKLLSIHRLVAIAFISNPDNKSDVNHINDIRYDNRVENLELCNQSENQIHAFKNGLQKGNAGRSNGSAKLTTDQVKQIKYFVNAPHHEIATLYNVSRRTIDRIIEGKIWKHIS